MKNLNSYLTLCILALFVLTGFESRIPNPCVKAIRYAEIKDIFNTSCAISRCHNPQGVIKGDFSSYHGLKNYISENSNFLSRIQDMRDMPPVYSPGPKALNEMEIQKIVCWVESDLIE